MCLQRTPPLSSIKFLRPNVLSNAELCLPGNVQARELDWTALQTLKSWSTSDTIVPPYDLIFTSDTIFSPELSLALLTAIHLLCTLSIEISLPAPLVYLALENRDPRLVDGVLKRARNDFNFSTKRVKQAKVSAALRKGGLDWSADEWEGIEIWTLALDS